MDARTLRIAVWHDLPSGGGRRALTNQLRELSKRGHEISVWSTPQGAGPLAIPPSISQQVVGLPPVRKGLHSLGPARLWEPPSNFQAIWTHLEQVSPLIRSWRPDVVFANSSLTLGAAPVARVINDLPSLLYLQEPDRSLFEFGGGPAWAAGGPVFPGGIRAWRSRLVDIRKGQRARVLVREQRASIASFDRVLVNSLFSRESLLRAVACDANVSYLGVDAVLFAAHGLPREDFVISVGRFLPYKRPEFVVDAVGHLSSPPSLVWVADQVDEAHLYEVRARAERHGVHLDVRVGIPDEELVDLLNRAFAFVYAPSLEPFGFAPLEAALCETPAVTVGEGGARETVLHNVTGLVTNGSQREFSSAIQALRENAALARTLGEAARARCIELFGMETSTSSLERHLAEVAERQSDGLGPRFRD